MLLSAPIGILEPAMHTLSAGAAIEIATHHEPSGISNRTEIHKMQKGIQVCLAPHVSMQGMSNCHNHQQRHIRCLFTHMQLCKKQQAWYHSVRFLADTVPGWNVGWV